VGSLLRGGQTLPDRELRHPGWVGRIFLWRAFGMLISYLSLVSSGNLDIAGAAPPTVLAFENGTVVDPVPGARSI